MIPDEASQLIYISSNVIIFTYAWAVLCVYIESQMVVFVLAEI